MSVLYKHFADSSIIMEPARFELNRTRELLSRFQIVKTIHTLVAALNASRQEPRGKIALAHLLGKVDVGDKGSDRAVV